LDDKSNIWWNQVSNAVRIINDISEHLAKEKSVALFFPEHIPWYDFFEKIIKERFHQSKSCYTITKPLDASKENIRDSNDVGKYIAEKYCQPGKLAEYWLGETYAQFLAESDDIVLNDKCVWVKGISKNDYQAWCSFVEEYKSFCDPMKKRAVFILEYLDDSAKSVSFNYKNLHIVSWEREIKKYDYYIFCSFLVSDLKCSDNVKHYIADLAYLLGECNAEFCAMLTGYKETFAENPAEILEKCAEQFRYSNGEKIHLKNLYTAQSTILEAQIKNVLPVIERYRNCFITNNYSRISKCLPITNSVNEEVKVPYDVDIGGLVYIAWKKDFSIEPSEKKELEFFHNSRNKIAHNNIICYYDVKKILSWFC